MSDVTKIKLPDNSEYNIKDYRIPGVDSTPTPGSNNVVTSGGVYNTIQTASVWEAGTGTTSVIIKNSSGTAGGNNSTVEGKGCVTGGTHSSYDLTPDTADTTAGSYAHAEGRYTIACGKQGSHAEGDRTLATSQASHAEGVSTIASGNYSHAEGGLTSATGAGAHAEGRGTTASGAYSHAEGYQTISSTTASHSEGNSARATGLAAHAEGYYTIANGGYSHAEGYKSVTLGDSSHAEGYSVSYGTVSHSESGDKGVDVFPVGAANATTYTSNFDSAEWNPVRNEVGDTAFCNVLKHSVIYPKNTANSNVSFAVKVTDATLSGETITFTTEETLSAENALDGSVNYWICYSVSYGDYSHSEGEGNVSYGTDSHAEGRYTFAVGNRSHVEGLNTIAKNVTEHAEGSFNVSNKTSTTYGNAGNTQHSIGIGNSTTRKNAVEVMQNGDVYIYGIGTYDGTAIAGSSTVQTVIDSMATVDSTSKCLTGIRTAIACIEGDDGCTYAIGNNNSGAGEDYVLACTSDIPTTSTNIASDKANNNKVAGAKAVYDEIHPAVVSSQPAGGFAPNVLYDLGTITGTVTFTMASPTDATIINHYYWTFETSSTAPTITWPAGITSWYGGSAPTISASKHYEISVLDGVGCIMEV